MAMRWVASLLLLCGIVAADAREDVDFALRLAQRGMADLGQRVCEKLVNSKDPEEVKAGKYGMAALTRVQAAAAVQLFLRAIEDGRTPPKSREEILGLYQTAVPDAERFVESAKGDLEAAGLLALLLQEYAEFLTGKNYPDEMADQKAKLLEENRKAAEGFFERAIKELDRVVTAYQEKVTDSTPEDDPARRILSDAMLNRAMMQYSYAAMLPPGPAFTNRVGQAIEELDEFSAQHFEDLRGGFAYLFLGRAYFEKGVKSGDDDSLVTARDFFEELTKRIEVQSDVPETADLVGRAFYHYVDTCNTLARGVGKVKAQPTYFDESKKAGLQIRERMKSAPKNLWALRARILVAEALAARREYDAAVAEAGEALAAARSEGLGSVARAATERLIQWVSSVSGSASLDPGVLFQIGESLAAQNRVGSAVTFYERAIAAASTPDQKERWGYPARLKIAQAYQRDRRFLAAAVVGMTVVDAYVSSGAGEDTPFAQVASEACFVASQSLYEVQRSTKRSEDDREYQRIVGIFRDKFPFHRANSDQAYTIAGEKFAAGDYEGAAEAFRQIGPSSGNYWRAQRQVPACWREMAKKDSAGAAKWYQKAADSAQELIQLAEKAGQEPKAKDARQWGHLFLAITLADLGKWAESLASIDEYFRLYGDVVLMKGREYSVKVQAHLQLGQMDNAETALARAKEKAAGSPFLAKDNYDVFSALKTAYEKMPPGASRLAIATRAGHLWEYRLGEGKEATVGDWYTYGQVLEASEQWEAAGEAYARAADTTQDVKQAANFKLLAAQMKFRAARLLPKEQRADYLKILNETWPLFVDVLIEQKEKQPAILASLADWQKYPGKDVFDAIKKSPNVILSAAEVLGETRPFDADGRWAAIRLLNMLHTLTQPVSNAANPNPKMDELIPTWWNAAELKVKLYIAIAATGAGQEKRRAADEGSGFLTKTMFEYASLDGPERLERFKGYQTELSRLR